MRKTLIIYIHIPKTAGTSFRQGLTQTLGRENVLFDYGSNEAETDNSILKLYEQGEFFPNRITQIIKVGKVMAICGHFQLSRYFKTFPDATVVSFVREPLQRSYSEYLHWKRHKGYNKSFKHFFQQKEQINLQSKWLDGLPENAIIGVSEYFDQSLCMINTAFGLIIPTLRLNCYRQNIKNAYETKDLTKEIATFYYQLNNCDVAFYNKISDRFFEINHLPNDKFSDHKHATPNSFQKFFRNLKTSFYLK